jgi:hypothetical protein
MKQYAGSSIMKKISLTLVLVLALSLFLSTTGFLPVSGTEDSWTTLEPMPTARSGFGVVAVNGKIYPIGGSTARGFAPSVPGSAVLGNSDIDKIVGTNEEYDPVFSDNEDSTEEPFNSD